MSSGILEAGRSTEATQEHRRRRLAGEAGDSGLLDKLTESLELLSNALLADAVPGQDASSISSDSIAITVFRTSSDVESTQNKVSSANMAFIDHRDGIYAPI